LKGHKDLINAVKWIDTGEDELLASGSVDKSVRIWKEVDGVMMSKTMLT
jgi:WD40 repeat protein